jgi:hypothetical protein
MTRTLVLAAALPLTFAGCGGRRHLTESHGRAYRETFAKQTVNPHAGVGDQRKPGLDSQEAAMVVKNYRKTLERESGGSEEGRGLILVAPQPGAAPYLPPPSVPPGR